MFFIFYIYIVQYTRYTVICLDSWIYNISASPWYYISLQFYPSFYMLVYLSFPSLFPLPLRMHFLYCLLLSDWSIQLQSSEHPVHCMKMLMISYKVHFSKGPGLPAALETCSTVLCIRVDRFSIFSLPFCIVCCFQTEQSSFNQVSMLSIVWRC